MTVRRKPRSLSFEDAMRRVIEQDGVTMVTPEGVCRRAKRIRYRTYARTEPSIFFESVSESTTTDPILEMDTAHVQSLVRQPRAKKEIQISVRKSAVKSDHVLSLSDVSLVSHRRRTDRLPDEYVPDWEDREARYSSPDIFGSLVHDLVLDQYDPYWVSDQFTHPEFAMSFRHVYGPLERLSSAFVSMGSVVTSVFHRVERIETRVAHEVKDVVTYVDLPKLQPIRAVGGFLALIVVVTLPAHALVAYRSASYTKDATETAGKVALSDLLAIRDSKNAREVGSSFQKASDRFHEADALLTDSGALALGIATLVPNQYRAARALLEIGEKTSEAGRLFTSGIEKMFEDPTRHTDERFELLSAYAEGILPLLDDAKTASDFVNLDVLPVETRETFVQMRGQLDDARTSFEEISTLAKRLALFFGKERTRTYLLVFQNQTELRPTGGFMGSVAEVTVSRGELQKITVPPGGTYDLQGQLLENVTAPKPLQLINARWEFQDSNWSPDFPTTAKKIDWFWSRAGQPTLDGIIAVNESFVEHILDITGPIELPEYGKTISSQNFLLETQMQVEVEYDKDANTPKKFVGDLGVALLDRMKTLSKDDWLRVAALLSEGLTTKDVQVYFSNEEEEQFAESLSWNGRMKETVGDSLSLIEANIAGQKTDGVITERVKHVAEISPDGSMIDTVTLTRNHTGKNGDLFSGVRNVSYLRVYVPRGSQLLSASGFDRPPANLFDAPESYFTKDADITAVESTMTTHPSGADISLEGSRTVFGGWLQLDPGNTQAVTFRYRLPFTVQDVTRRISDGNSQSADQTGEERAYLLLLTSQSGKTQRSIVSEIQYPIEWDLGWSSGVIPRAGSAVFEGTWDRDHVSAGLFRLPVHE